MSITIDHLGRRAPRVLLDAVAGLSDGDAVLVLLATRHGVSYRDIAASRGMAPAEVARRLRFAMMRMREGAFGQGAESR